MSSSARRQPRLESWDASTDFSLFDPYLRPDWRYERVLTMLDGTSEGERRTTKRDDPWVKQARSFLMKYRKSDESRRLKLRHENPGLWFAYQVYNKLHEDPEIQFLLEALLLTGADLEEIAYESQMLTESVEWYEKLFFNVLPRLDRHIWMTKHVLLPAFTRQNAALSQLNQPQVASDDDDSDSDEAESALPSTPVPPYWVSPQIARPHLDASLKFFAYYGGPVLFDFVLNGFRRGVPVRTQEEISDWLNDTWMLMTQRRSLQTMQVLEINKFNAVDLFASHTRIMEIQKTADNQGDRQSFMERHINAMLTELPWTVGQRGAKMHAGTRIGNMDETAVELRADELLLINSGSNLEEIKNLASIEFPKLIG